jgi:flagellar L-ring protein precursor FlgH
MKRVIRITCVTLLLSAVGPSQAAAQNSSLMHAPMMNRVSQMQGGSTSRSAPLGPTAQAQVPLQYVGQPGQGGAATSSSDRPPIQLDRASWTYQPPPALRAYRINDPVTVRVDEITRVMAEGSAESRKRTLYETILTDWIRLQDFRLRPDPQANGDPAIAAESNKNYRAESTIESRESLTFNIAATVVDIRPNGNLVLEASKTIRVNDNLWETSLMGICRVQDIAPDNVVFSKDLIDLEIRKEDRGHLRDGYKRGWLQRFIDRFQFF